MQDESIHTPRNHRSQHKENPSHRGISYSKKNQTTLSFPKAIQRLMRAQVNPSIRYRGCRITIFAHFIDRKNLPVLARFQHGHFALVTHCEYLSVRRHWGGKIITQSTLESCLL